MEQREHYGHCMTHESHDREISALARVCAENSRMCASNSTTIQLMIKFLGGSIVILVTVLTVFIPMMYHNSKQTNSQILSTISGVSRNRKDIARHENMLESHELRLRNGGL